jgi:arsenate reductase
MKIIKELNLDDSFKLREIKNNPINSLELNYLYNKTESYEALFNKRAVLFR